MNDTQQPEHPQVVFPQMDAKFREVTVGMYEGERAKAVLATEAAAYALHNAAAIFRMIHRFQAGGYFRDDEAGLIALAEVCADHFRALADDEGETLQRLHYRLADGRRVTGEEGESAT
jgi:hypothetical protein